jgi:hypothetical protein
MHGAVPCNGFRRLPGQKEMTNASRQVSDRPCVLCGHLLWPMAVQPSWPIPAVHESFLALQDVVAAEVFTNTDLLLLRLWPLQHVHELLHGDLHCGAESELRARTSVRDGCRDSQPRRSHLQQLHVRSHDRPGLFRDVVAEAASNESVKTLTGPPRPSLHLG